MCSVCTYVSYNDVNATVSPTEMKSSAPMEIESSSLAWQWLAIELVMPLEVELGAGSLNVPAQRFESDSGRWAENNKPTSTK